MSNLSWCYIFSLCSKALMNTVAISEKVLPLWYFIFISAEYLVLDYGQSQYGTYQAVLIFQIAWVLPSLLFIDDMIFYVFHLTGPKTTYSVIILWTFWIFNFPNLLMTRRMTIKLNVGFVMHNTFLLVMPHSYSQFKNGYFTNAKIIDMIYFP